MAHSAYLYNVPSPLANPYDLLEADGTPSQAYVYMRGPAYRLPVPWLCCFRPEDLKQVFTSVQGRDEDDERHAVKTVSSRTLAFPSTSLSQAIHNLERALPLFEAMAGDARLGRAYWEDALTILRRLPLPYLVLNHTRILDTWGPEQTRKLASAMGGDMRALAFLEEWSRYESGIAPYPRDVLWSSNGPDEMRAANAIALSMPSELCWRRPDGAGQRDRESIDVTAWFVPRGLYTILEKVRALVGQRDPRAIICYGYMDFGMSRLARLGRRFGVGRPERLKLLLQASTCPLLLELLADRNLRQELEGRIADELRTICAGYKFEWHGFVFESLDSLQSKCDDMDAWVALPAMQPLTD